jgi:Fe-S-cluster containining protein
MRLSKKKIVERLNNIYSKIPDFNCQHCHECEGPIIWFKPEEINIRDYLDKNNLEYIIWSTEEFQKNNMKCPYLKNDRCSIYPVRPIVCRLQGNIAELPCKFNNKIKLITDEKYHEIKNEFNNLLKDIDGFNICYSTRRHHL